MTVLAETEPIARNVVMVGSDTQPELIAELKQLLLNLDQTPEGNKILQEFGETAKFDEFPTDKSIERMREIYALIQNR